MFHLVKHNMSEEAKEPSAPRAATIQSNLKLQVLIFAAIVAGSAYIFYANSDSDDENDSGDESDSDSDSGSD